jgi:hypothetical protein
MLNAMKAAVPGDIVALKPGVYSGISNYGKPLGPVGGAKDSVIVTSDDLSKKATINDFMWQAPVYGTTFRDLDLNATAAPQRQMVAYIIAGGSVNTGIDRCSLHGLMDGSAYDALQKFNISAVQLRGGTNLFVTRCEIQRFGGGIGHLDNNGVLIQGNKIHDIRVDAIDGGGSSNIWIDSNELYNWWPELPDGSGLVSHPDGIQFWTTNTKAPCKSIKITNNKIRRQDGGQAQGIFMGNELHLRYQDVVITGNRVEGGIWHGISVFEADNVTINNNIVGVGVPYKDPRLPATSQVVTSNWIKTGNVTGLTCLQNWADEFALDNTSIVSYGRNSRNTAGQIGK